MAKGVTVENVWCAGQVMKKITATFEADDGTPDNAFPTSATIGPIDGWINRMVVKFGTTAPTSGELDFTIKDSDGATVMTAITDVTDSYTELPDNPPYVGGSLTVTCAGTNLVASATFKMIFYVQRG